MIESNELDIEPNSSFLVKQARANGTCFVQGLQAWIEILNELS